MNSEMISQNNLSFLEKVKVKGNLEDIYDARDLVEVVYRTMRDLMTKEEIENVASELNEETISTDNKPLQNEISDLWKDRNPLVSWLSRIRQPLEIKDENFIKRIELEGGMPKSTDGEKVIKAVFSATKDELSQERIQEIANILPGKIQTIWLEA